MSDGHLFIGLMSGTSVDAIDAVLVRCHDDAVELRNWHSAPIPRELRQRLFGLCRGENDTLHNLCTLDRELGDEFASAALALLDRAGVAPGDIAAIGCHGQTVRHCPAAGDAPAYTLQIGDANHIAERTGVCTVADFRRRDIAAGGEGAPLVPLFHAAVFGRAGERRAIVNIGGIANATVLDGHRVAAGFDCGPGNTLLDSWVRSERGEAYDADGRWAAAHTVDEPLLQRLLSDCWFERSGPRSTGPEYFNEAWLRRHLPQHVNAGSVQATLSELTARSIAGSLAGSGVEGLWVCGGGALNRDLMHRLERAATALACRLGDTGELGLPPRWVEASAFAWLARQRLASRPGNSPAATGATGPRILGAVYAGTVSDGE